MATFTVNGVNTTISFIYTAPTASIISIVGDAGELLYGRDIGNIFTGPDDSPVLTPYTSLTNQQKLNVVDGYLKQVILTLSNTAKANRAVDAARATQDAAKYNL